VPDGIAENLLVNLINSPDNSYEMGGLLEMTGGRRRR
jgi:hypothetical protein